MVELLGGGVLGSVLGGVFRLVPEFLKAFDRKNERSHELSMFDRQCRLEEQRGAQKMAEIGAVRDLAVDAGAMTAFNSAIEQQTEMVKAAGKGWVASLSASVRPVLTYYLLLMYGAVKIALISLSVQGDMPMSEAILKNWTPDDMALLMGVINYWMLDRSLAKRGL